MPLLAGARCLLSEQGGGNMRERPAAGRCRRWTAAAVTVFLAGSCLGAQPTPQDRADVAPLAAAVKQRGTSDYAFLEALYKQFHTHPELSGQEERTAARLASELREIGVAVTEKVGGHGVVGVLRNGRGPTVLVRAELDALPVMEQTGLPYASTVKARDPQGKEVGVMHACGHDLHLTCLVGVARVLAGMKDRWRGTLLLVGQPAEELGLGARRMIADGLFTRFPKPDYCLALHCLTGVSGSVLYREGPALANSDTVDITVRGRGGHGAQPHRTVDPIVLAARIILDLQTLVSREINPTDPAVVTVGSIHGGAKHNIIPNEVHLQLSVRSYTDSVRAHLLGGIERITRAAAQGARAPEPIVRVGADRGGTYTPAAVNDPTLTRRIMALFRQTLSPEKVVEIPPQLIADDFGMFSREGIPSCIYFLGLFSPERVAEAGREGGRPLPSNHSDQYYPIPEPTIKTGVLTMSMAVLRLLERRAP
jgi:amidohydrolase